MKAVYGPGVGPWLTDDQRADIADALPSWATAEITKEAPHRFRATLTAPNSLGTAALGRTPWAAFDAALRDFEDTLA
jgi:hypothetical protein